MIRWMRVVLPPYWVIVLAVFTYCLAEGPTLYSEFLVGQTLDLPVRGGAVFFHVLAIAYGVYRVLAFHPIYRPNYANWLNTTPWARDKPLPLGPVVLVAQDAAVLLVTGLAALLQKGLEPWHLLPTFFAGYLLPLAFALWLSDQWLPAYAIAFGVGAMVSLSAMPGVRLAFALAFLAVAWIALWRSWLSFPQFVQFAEQFRLRTGRTRKGLDSIAPKLLGWPYDYLPPSWKSERTIARHDKIMACLLFSWWFYVGGTLLPKHPESAKILLAVNIQAILVATVARTFRYCMGFWPPISLLGRVCSGGWLIPGYDIVFVAPVLTFLVGFVLPFRIIGKDLEFLPLFQVLALLLCFNLGPSYKSWCLTGNHRISRPIIDNPAYVKVS